MRRILALAVCVLTLGVSLPAEAAPAERSCIHVVFGFRELASDDARVEMAGTARSALSDTEIRKVSYKFVGSNSDGYRRVYKGTDPSDSEGGWERLVYPKVGWGHITFSYQITATMRDGTVCKSNKHTQTLDRQSTEASRGSMELFPHQVRGIQAAAARFRAGGRGFYLRWDPGCGKTLGAILLAKALGYRSVGVVGPVISLGVWEREIKKWWPEARGAVLRNGAGSSWRWFDSSPVTFHISNYEQLRDNAEIRTQFLNFADVDRGKLDLLICDEAQAVKSVSAQTTKTIGRLALKFQHVLLLSGTPAHSPLDWYAQFKLVAPEDPYWTEQTFTQYKKRVAYLGGPNNNWVQGFDEREKLEAVRHVLPYCHIATSAELNLPEPIWSPVTFRLSEEESHAYREMDRNLFLDLGEGRSAGAELVITKLLRLHQITGGHVTSEDGSPRPIGRSKLAALADLLAERTNQKVVIACRFRWEIDAIANMVGFREGSLGNLRAGRTLPNGTISDGGHIALTITGDTPQSERGRIEDLFQLSGSPIALILQYRAGGASITLSKADCMIFYSFEPSTIAFRQAIGRVWRIGQTGHVQMIPLMAEGTVDEKMFRGLQLGLDGVDLARYALENT